MILEINIEMVYIILSILAITFAAIIWIFKIYKSVNDKYSKDQLEISKTLSGVVAVVNDLVEEVTKLKGYDKRITNNETDIKLINQRCAFYHEEKD